MGYNTSVIVMNDALSEIERDPDFGKKLSRACSAVFSPGRPRQNVSAMGHINAATVIESHHADGMHLLAMGGNIGYDLGRCGNWRDDDPEALLRGLADKLGYRIVKKNKS